MNSKKKRTFSAEFKATVVVEVISGHAGIAELARKHQVARYAAGWSSDTPPPSPKRQATQPPDVGGSELRVKLKPTPPLQGGVGMHILSIDLAS